MKILKRCDVCDRWGAAYLVNLSQQAALRVCYPCWKRYFAPGAVDALPPAVLAGKRRETERTDDPSIHKDKAG